MKLKQKPDDFVVDEQTDVTPGQDGPFALYRLEKRGWTTPDALAAIRRRWKLDARRVSYGGLKDRHAFTRQYFTVYRGPRRRLTHHDIAVEYLGQIAAPFTSRDIRANRFHITLRALTDAERDQAAGALPEVSRTGLPNYFDDQRFGSVSPDGQFVAREMVLGQHEQALRLALAAPYAHDRAAQKEEKRILNESWGDWVKCRATLPRGHARSLADYLASHPTDFRGALERLRPELRGLYLSAYQSHLWNRLLAVWLKQMCRPEQVLSMRLRHAALPVPFRLDEAQAATFAGLVLPLPSSRTMLAEGDPLHDILKGLYEEEGLTDLKLRGFKRVFFSRGYRPARVVPADMTHTTAEDELNPKREKLVLGFELPRGAYATILVKRLTATA